MKNHQQIEEKEKINFCFIITFISPVFRLPKGHNKKKQENKTNSTVKLNDRSSTCHQ